MLYLRGALFALLLALLPGLLTAQTFSRQSLFNSSATAGIVSADFSGDGLTDFATIDANGYAVRVFWNQGTGTFPHYGTAVYFIPHMPLQIVTGDLNKDGYLDLVTISSPCLTAVAPSHFSVLLGNGDGTFRSAVSTETPFCSDAVTIADLNKDGAPDLAFTADFFGGDSRIHIYKNDGAAHFSPLTTIRSPAAWNSLWGISSGDYNRDGRIDLAAMGLGEEPEHKVYIFFNNGNMTFTPKPVAITYRPTNEVNTADVNRDGALDLLVTFDSGVLAVINNGNATGWTYRTKSASSEYAVGGKVAVADFNLDGLPDLAISLGEGAPETKPGFVIFPGTSLNNWGNGKYFFTDAEEGFANALTAARLSRDVRPDLVFGIDRELKVLLNTTTCTPPTTSPAVNICAPSGTGEAISPVIINTSARWDGRNITYVRAYVDGVAKCGNVGPNLACNVSLTSGMHSLTVNAWTGSGEVITARRTFLVK